MFLLYCCSHFVRGPGIGRSGTFVREKKEGIMKFMLIGRGGKHPMPPEIAAGVFEATIQWHKNLMDSGKGEVSWGVAGQPIGLDVVNVDSLEELDEIVNAFPLAPFGDMEVLPLIDMAESLERTKQAVQAMTPGG